MKKLCPIIWTKEDGLYPCAFKRGGNCNRIDPNPWAPPCIPLYKERFYHALESVTTKCPQCESDTETARGDAARGLLSLCPSCSKDYQEGQALAAHIRGEI